MLEGVDERLRGRTRRGKTMARSGHVQSIDIAPGTVYAEVADGGDVHRPTLRVRTYDEEEWRRVLDVLSQQLELLAALLEGDVGSALLDALERDGVSLFPRRSEIDGDCDCGDYAVPCAHGAAVHHLLADALEGEPLLMFALRGRPREQLLAEVRRAWGDASIAPSVGSASAEEAPPPGDWFASPTPLPAMRYRFSQANRSPGLLELGPLAGDGDLLKTLEPLYQAGAEAATELALTDLPNTDTPRRRRPPTPVPAATVVAAEPDQPAPPQPNGNHTAREDDDIEVREPEVLDMSEMLVDALAEIEDGASTRQLADVLGIPTIRVRRELVELESVGVVVRTGSTRSTRWWLG